MSKIARWTYTNTALVRPFLGVDEWGAASYGPAYAIACTWIAAEYQEFMVGGQGGAQGTELVAKHDIFTEDPRPQYLDKILLNGETLEEEIRRVTSYDMSPFADIPDYKLTTG